MISDNCSKCGRCVIQVLRSNNTSKFNSAEVRQIYQDHAIKLQFSSPGGQFQNGKGGGCIGDAWIMTKVALLSLMFLEFCAIIVNLEVLISSNFCNFRESTNYL